MRARPLLQDGRGRVRRSRCPAFARAAAGVIRSRSPRITVSRNVLVRVHFPARSTPPTGVELLRPDHQLRHTLRSALDKLRTTGRLVPVEHRAPPGSAVPREVGTTHSASASGLSSLRHGLDRRQGLRGSRGRVRETTTLKWCVAVREHPAWRRIRGRPRKPRGVSLTVVSRRSFLTPCALLTVAAAAR